MLGKPLVIVRRSPSRRDHPAQERERPLGIEARALWSTVIRGEPTPQARMHDVVLTDGMPRLVRSRPARLWQNRAMTQLLNRRPERPLTVDLVLECRFWSSRRDPALEEGLVIDLLERAAIIAHGSQIREKHVFASIDSGDPRLMVTLARCYEVQ